MKFKFYLSLIILISIGSIGNSQNFARFLSDFSSGTSTSDDDIFLTEDCYNNPNSFENVDFIQVSGLPILSNEFNLDAIDFWINTVTSDFDMTIVLTSPSGTIIELANTDFGSWPGVNAQGFYKVRIEDCSAYPNHDQSFLMQEDEAGADRSLINSFEAWKDQLIGEDPNGQWTVSFCTAASQMISYDPFVLRFKSSTPYAVEFKTTNASTCESPDGVAEIDIVAGSCNFDFFYSIDGSPTLYGSHELDELQFITQTFLSLTAGSHTIKTYAAIDPSTPDLSTLKVLNFTIGADDTSGESLEVNCAPDEVRALDELYTIIPPTIDAVCFSIVEITKLTYNFPDGSSVTNDPYDPNEAYQLQLDQEGEYTIVWSIVGESLNGIISNATCSQLITVDPNAVKTFSSAICDAPTPQNVTSCGSTANSQFFPVTISGLPPNLSPDYGLRGVYLDLNITDFSTQQPYVDIVDPTGFRHRLFNPFTFSQFDGNTQSFRVYISACNSAGIPRCTEDVPFVEDGTYRPMLGALNVANQRGIDPNGTWQLQTCAGSTWSINCFELEFGNMCATANDYSFGEENCQTYVQVMGSDISDAFCDDMNEDGLPDYYIGIDNGPVTKWDPAEGLKVFVTAGPHVMEFGEMQTDENGNTIFACRQFIDIDAPAPTPDTEAPMLVNCPANQTVQLDANGAATFNLTLPQATDNCVVLFEFYNITYSGGATDENGQTSAFFDTPQGTFSYNVVGAGQVSFDFSAEDGSGNIGNCNTLITVNGSNDPCDNDTQAPVFSNCPADFTVQLDGNNQATFDITEPDFTDNCNIVSESLLITYLDGTTATSGETMFGPYTDILSGETFPYNIMGAGRVQFDFNVTDEGNNVGTCLVTVTSSNNDPCDNDTEAPMLVNCPADLTVQLDANGAATFNLTLPQATDNCVVIWEYHNITLTGGTTDEFGQTSAFFLTQQGTFAYNVLGAGQASFVFSAEDGAGNTGTCQTVITVNGSNDPCANDTQNPIFIDCPGNQTIVLDDTGFGQFNLTDPDFSDNCTIVSGSLTINYLGGSTNGQGETMFTYSPLEPGTNFTYPMQGVGTVEFNFEVVDQAGNTGQCVSVITSKEPTGACDNDTENPTLANCQQNSSVTLDNNNQATFSVKAPDAADNCGIATTSVTITYTGGATDENGDVSRNFVSFTNGVTRDFTIVGAGQATFEFSVLDPSGNLNACTTTITSNFGGTDVICNIKEECIVAGSTLSLPLRVTNFVDIGAFGFDLSVPANSGLSFVGLENENISNVSFNVLGNGDLRVSWDEPSGNDLTLDNNTRIFNVVITASSSFATATTISGKDVVILQSGVPVAGRVDLATICVGSGVTPSGKIYSPLNRAHAGVKVNLVGGSNVISDVNSNAQGDYSFAVTNNTFKITPTKNDEVRLGVGISDVARIRRHYLQKLFLDSDYKIVAADVNKDAKIDVIDIAYTNRVFLKKLNEFPGNTAWRFIPVAADISKNPLNVNIPNQINLSASGLDFNNLDFYSIKTGDVDHSALNNFRGNSTDNRIDVSISVPDTVVSPQEMVEIPVYLSGTDRVSALSFTMKYNTAVVELVSIKAPNLSGFSAGSYNDIDGEVLIGWDHKDGEDVNAEGVLMMMTFASKVAEGKSDITLEGASVFDINLDEIGVSTQSGSVDFMTSSVNGLTADYKVTATPNPFVNIVNIEVNTNTPQQLSIKFTDATGKILKQMRTKNSSTNHLITIDDLEAKGVIIVLVEGENFSEALRLIKL